MSKRMTYPTVREYLKQTEMSQVELARRVGVHQTTISRAALGEPISWRLALRIANETGVPLSSMLPEFAGYVR